MLIRYRLQNGISVISVTIRYYCLLIGLVKRLTNGVNQGWKSALYNDLRFCLSGNQAVYDAGLPCVINHGVNGGRVCDL